MTPPTPTLRVIDNHERARFELLVDGRFEGFLDYKVEPGVFVLDHAEIRPEVRGIGLGRRLVAGALDDLRRRGLPIEPRCGFVDRFIREHPEYQDLVARPERRTRRPGIGPIGRGGSTAPTSG